MTTPASVAAAFVRAIASGDERALWHLFSETARVRIIDIGEHQGLPAALAAKVRNDTATAEEMETFLVDVLDGLRRDLEWSTVTSLEPEVVLEAGDTARVALIEPLTVQLPGTPPGLPAAWLTLVEAGGWYIDTIDLPGR
jgi:hypothetical protein